ncbi:hypothetical protein AU381_23485 [Sinorhizobium glycinis]|uniref:Uncharacterized protein n=1 Tax=Sinorhizobium glycinis TaxID=1472378 RepID=A0A178XUS2_9HYPH|nr:hypothetical protein AU381_23485 [Sinorhizobium glycinis]
MSQLLAGKCSVVDDLAIFSDFHAFRMVCPRKLEKDDRLRSRSQIEAEINALCFHGHGLKRFLFSELETARSKREPIVQSEFIGGKFLRPQLHGRCHDIRQRSHRS